jgi:hypothetical protein
MGSIMLKYPAESVIVEWLGQRFLSSRTLAPAMGLNVSAERMVPEQPNSPSQAVRIAANDSRKQRAKNDFFTQKSPTNRPGFPKNALQPPKIKPLQILRREIPRAEILVLHQPQVKGNRRLNPLYHEL